MSYASPLQASRGVPLSLPQMPARQSAGAGEMGVAGGSFLLEDGAGGWERLWPAALGLADSIGARGIIWVCLQQPAVKVRARLGDWGGELVLVDAVSRAAGVAGGEPGILYCESPGAIHTILASIHGLLQKGPHVVVWDSLNAALPYTTGESLLRAITSVNARVFESGSAVLYYLVEGSADPRLTRSLEGSVDRVMEPRSPTWKQVLSLEKPLLYGAMTAMAAINAGLTLVLMKLVHL